MADVPGPSRLGIKRITGLPDALKSVPTQLRVPPSIIDLRRCILLDKNERELREQATIAAEAAASASPTTKERLDAPLAVNQERVNLLADLRLQRRHVYIGDRALAWARELRLRRVVAKA